VTGTLDLAVGAAVGKLVVPSTVPGQLVAVSGTLVVVAASVLATVVPLFPPGTIVFVNSTADGVLVELVLATSAVEAPVLDDEEAALPEALFPGSSLLGGVDGHEFASLLGGAFGDPLGPDPMPGLVPMFPRLVEPHSDTPVTFAESLGAVGLPLFPGVHGEVPVVLADNVPLLVVIGLLLVVLEPKSVLGLVGDTGLLLAVDDGGHFLFSADVAEPEKLASPVNQVDGVALTGNEGVSTIGEAPAAVETVSGDTLVFGLHPRDQLFELDETPEHELTGGIDIGGSLRLALFVIALSSVGGVENHRRGFVVIVASLLKWVAAGRPLGSAVVDAGIIAVAAKILGLAVGEAALAVVVTVVVLHETVLGVEGGEDLGHHGVVVDVGQELVVDELLRGVLIVLVEGVVPPVKDAGVLLVGLVGEVVARAVVVGFEGLGTAEGVGDVLVKVPSVVLVVTELDVVDGGQHQRSAGQRRDESHGGPPAFN